ncbi:MAG: guanylate kinase [Sedimenticola sp.]|nr:guanylate kinase [Sedimenticola sp.]
MTKGTLFIVSAPSGAGKTSLLKALVQTEDRVKVSVSHTTRPRRSGEVDAVDYHFLDVNAFRQMIDEGDFLEHAEVFGNYYGTSEAGILDQLDCGNDVILEIDWQGAQQVRKRIPGTVSIFILPPTPEALRQRLSSRGQDSESVIRRRLAEAREEMSHYAEYDYIVVNDLFEQALGELRSIIMSRRLTLEVQSVQLQDRLRSLLA